jgi:hypothetical protein
VLVITGPGYFGVIEGNTPGAGYCGTGVRLGVTDGDGVIGVSAKGVAFTFCVPSCDGIAGLGDTCAGVGVIFSTGGCG